MPRPKKATLALTSKSSILKIPNNFLRSNYTCSATTQRLFYYSIFKYLTSTPSTDGAVSFNYAEFFSDLDLPDGSKSRELIKQNANEILTMQIVLQDDDEAFEKINIFELSRCEFNSSRFSLQFTHKMTVFLSTLKKLGYSSFKLKTIGSFDSYYALRYYLIAISYKGFMGKKGNNVNKWYFDYTVEELRNLFALSEDSYTHGGVFKQKLVDLPIKELNSKDLGLTIEYTTIKTGKKITGYHFICSATDGKDDVPLLEEKPKKSRTKKVAAAFDESAYIESLKAQYPERYCQILMEELKNTSPMNLSAETRAGFRLMEEYPPKEDVIIE